MALTAFLSLKKWNSISETRASKVGVAFEKVDLLYLSLMRTGVAQNVEAIADVDHVDQTVPQDGVAPQNHFVGTTTSRDVEPALSAVHALSGAKLPDGTIHP